MPGHFRTILADFIDVKIKESGKSVPGEFNDDSPLISSGLLESLHLLELALLVEEEVRAPLDLTTLDFAKEWDTLNRILNFVKNYKP